MSVVSQFSLFCLMYCTKIFPSIEYCLLQAALVLQRRYIFYWVLQNLWLCVINVYRNYCLLHVVWYCARYNLTWTPCKLFSIRLLCFKKRRRYKFVKRTLRTQRILISPYQNSTAHAWRRDYIIIHYSRVYTIQANKPWPGLGHRL
jgi:hypothetical protein